MNIKHFSPIEFYHNEASERILALLFRSPVKIRSIFSWSPEHVVPLLTNHFLNRQMKICIQVRIFGGFSIRSALYRLEDARREGHFPFAQFQWPTNN